MESTKVYTQKNLDNPLPQTIQTDDGLPARLVVRSFRDENFHFAAYRDSLGIGRFGSFGNSREDALNKLRRKLEQDGKL